MVLPKILTVCGLLATGTVCACGDASGPTNAEKAVSPNLGTLGIGQTRTLTLAQASGGLIVPKGNSGALYLVTLTNLSTVDTGIVPQYTSTGDVIPSNVAPLGAGVTASPVLSRLRHPLETRPRREPFGPARMRAETMFRRFTMRDVAPVFQRSPQLRLARAPGLRRDVQVPQVGDKIAVQTPVNGCEDPVATTAYVKAVSTHAIVLSDSASPAGGFTSQDFTNIANQFDQLTYATVTNNFGTPTDIDGNGGRVFIYFTPYINSLSPTDASQGYVGGGFFAGDLLPSTVCPSSNNGEIFYLVTPDPSGLITQAFSREDVYDVAFGTMAHEFVHMINAGHKLNDPNATSFEVAWMDEGLAHMSEHIVGRAAAGLSNNVRLDVNTLAYLPDSLWYAYFGENFERAYEYLSRPDTTGPIVNEDRAENSLAARGAVWSLLQFADDQYSHGDRSAFTRALTLSSDTGLVNLLAQVGVPIDTVLTHWHGALAAESQTIVGLNSGFSYNSYFWGDIFSDLQGPNGYIYPLPMTVLTGTTAVSAGIPGSSAASFRVIQSSTATRHVQFVGTGGAVADPDIRITITRVH